MDKEKDFVVFPNQAPISLVRKCPPAIFLTSEYDDLKKATVEGAELYRKAGKCIGLGI